MNRRHFLWYSLLLAAGCAAAQETANIPTNSTSIKTLQKLRFSVTDAEGMEDLERDYEPFRASLSEILGVPVEFFPVENYFAAAAALQSDSVDLVWSGPAEYVIINARTNAVPIIGITRPDYFTVLGVRADSGIKSVADLRGKTLDVRKEGSTSSHLGAIKLLIDAGLDPQTDVNIIMSGEYSLKGLQAGEADAIALNPHRYRELLAEVGASEADYPLIASGDPLPSDVIMASSHLEEGQRNEIQARILASSQALMDSILSVETIGFRFAGATLDATGDADYDMIRQAYQAIGQGDFLRQ